MEDKVTPGPCELSAMCLSASKMFGFTDHPPWQGEKDEKDGSDDPPYHMWRVLQQPGQCKNSLTSTCQGI